MADHQITFNAGALDRTLLLKILLVAAGAVTDETPLTVEITVSIDVGIGESVDSDIAYGLSDGINFIGFKTLDKGNYHRFVPCFEIQAKSGSTIFKRHSKMKLQRQATNSTPISLSLLSS